MISQRAAARKLSRQGAHMSSGFSIGARRYDSKRALVIAEIGTGHGGDLGKARELVAAASEAGADCAKFQCVFADEIIHPNTGNVPLPGGPVPLYHRFLELEEDEDFYSALKESAEAKGLLFLCSPFGLRSARLLRRIGCEAMKVASPELNHFPLLDEIASYGLPTIVSSGVSTLSDIDRALRRFDGRSGGQAEGRFGALSGRIALLHCVTAYPAPASDYNLRVLRALGGLLGLPTGVSDHSLDPVLIPALAVAAGGIIVEKHICLSRSDPGLDDPIALPPESFARMSRAIRAAQAAGGDQTIAAMASEYGAEAVEAALGDGIKRLAPSEAENYNRTNRSIHAMRDIKRGEPFEEKSLAVLRTEKVLRPGLDPEFLPILEGRRAMRDIPSGEGIEWEDVGGR
jgi:sialic acid synthase SpsE